jgi:hypothetical protein
MAPLYMCAAVMLASMSSVAGVATKTVDGVPIYDGEDLQRAVNGSIAAGEVSFQIAPGAYYFDDGLPLLLYRAQNWSLVAEPGRVTLWFRVTQRWRTGGVLILECEDVRVYGLTVDYDPPTHYQGTVLSLASGPIAGASASKPGQSGGTPSGLVACYRRMDVDVPKCHKDQSAAELHRYNRTLKSWTTLVGFNCYPGAGANIVPGPEPWPCCNTGGGKRPQPVSLPACQAACASEVACTAIITILKAAPSPTPSPVPGKPMLTALVQTDPGFPEPHQYITTHSTANDPSDNYVNAPAIWPQHIGYGCNRTLGCPGHGAGVLQPRNTSLPRGINRFKLLASARVGDKITISIRKGITWHVQNSTRILSANISIHSASLFGLSEFDGGGGHRYEDVWLGRRKGVGMTQLCGRTPGRLCFGVLASNADAFHSSGTKVGPGLYNVTLSNNFDDFLNVHSRMQLLGDKLGDTEIIVLDPRLQVAQGVPDDTPYGAAETMPNAKPGDVLAFHALNTFVPHGFATIKSLVRVSAPTAIKNYGAAVANATSGRPPWRMTPPMSGNVQPDVGQLCQAFAKQHKLPECLSRVWRVSLAKPLPQSVQQFDIVSLEGWDSAGLSVVNSHFFGGIDGVHSKSNGAVFSNNVMACTGFDVSPWQHYLEGPPHLENMTVRGNTFTACGGVFGTMRVNCSGLNNGTNLPTYAGPTGHATDGFCTGVGGAGVMVPSTCDMHSMVIEDNHGPMDCTVFGDRGAQSTCCSACGTTCKGC